MGNISINVLITLPLIKFHQLICLRDFFMEWFSLSSLAKQDNEDDSFVKHFGSQSLIYLICK